MAKRARLSDGAGWSNQHTPSASPAAAPTHSAGDPPDADLKGRYISKRERAVRPAATTDATPSAPTVEHAPRSAPPPAASVDAAPLPQDLPACLSDTLALKGTRHEPACAVPSCHRFDLQGHKGPVHCVRWSPRHGDLLLSAGSDGTALVWDAMRDRRPVRRLTPHAAAIREAQWNFDSTKVLTGSYDCSAVLTDVEAGAALRAFPHTDHVTALRFNPHWASCFVSGDTHGRLACWDTRTGARVREYHAAGLAGTVQDIEFLRGGEAFITASDIAKRSATDRCLNVWDFDKRVIISPQISTFAFTCSCVRLHPSGHSFVAQSNGGYLALYSAHAPFRVNKSKRFEGHEVGGNRVQCSFSHDGTLLATGSADGALYLYSYGSGKLVKRIPRHSRLCADVAFHPLLPSTMASAGWDGVVAVYS
eukprot:jgi/Mesvir1/29656/Mv21498-RA.1